MSVTVRNFNTAEVQILNATSTSGFATYSTDGGKKGRDLRVINNGPNDAWILPVAASSTPVLNIAGSVAGTKATYVKAGEDIVVSKCPGGVGCAFIAGITDTGTAQLILHSGKGS